MWRTALRSLRLDPGSPPLRPVVSDPYGNFERMSETLASTPLMRIGRRPAYPVRMTVSAHDVAAELRDRLPGLGAKKLHKLLYYCQGHHLATFGEPLFGENIGAWDMGPVVEPLWRDERYEPPLPPGASSTRPR
jgi:hypothetical protein